MNSKFHVLLVDDDAALHNTVRDALALDHAGLTSAFDATDALELLAGGQFDLLLLDLGLPDLDGIELLHRLRTEGRLEIMPVIVLTGWASTSDKVGGLEAGASDYITKPVEVAELRARVRAILRQWKLQQELRRTNAELERALKLAEAGTRTKNQFLANISHEFRTPLNGVIASSGLLLASDITAAQRELAETIQQSGESLLAKVTDVLDFARIEKGDFKLNTAPFPLREGIASVLTSHGPQALRKGLELICDIGPSLPDTFIGDSERLRQVIFRLVDNAVKFTECGEVTVRVQGHAIQPDPQGPPASSPAWKLRFDVIDTGCGMDTGQLEQVFQLFTQVDESDTRRQGGMGLGLTLSRGVVREMGGELNVQSRPGEGSMFFFEIPLPCPDPKPHRFESARVLDGKRFVLITRSAALRASIEQTLLAAGMRTCAVASATPDTMLQQDTLRPDFWVVEVDARGDNARGLAASIKGVGAGQTPARVIGLGVTRHGNDALRQEFHAWVEKPVLPKALFAALAQALQGPSVEDQPAVKGRGVTEMRILAVDDNPINLRIATRMLEKIGVKPDTAPDGASAVEAARRHPYNLILMDSQMPGMDGCAATSAIRKIEAEEARPPCAIVAMTANAMPEERERCRLAGMDDFVTKPVRLEMLESLVRRFQAPPSPVGSNRTEPVTDNAVQPGKPPVDVSRLEDFCDGDRSEIRELFAAYATQARVYMDDLKRAVKEGHASETRRLAHACCGASAQCGVHRVAALLGELEQQAARGDLGQAERLSASAEFEFARACEFMEGWPAGRETGV